MLYIENRILKNLNKRKNTEFNIPSRKMKRNRDDTPVGYGYDYNFDKARKEIRKTLEDYRSIKFADLEPVLPTILYQVRLISEKSQRVEKRQKRSSNDDFSSCFTRCNDADNESESTSERGHSTEANSNGSSGEERQNPLRNTDGRSMVISCAVVEEGGSSDGHFADRSGSSTDEIEGSTTTADRSGSSTDEIERSTTADVLEMSGASSSENPNVNEYSESTVDAGPSLNDPDSPTPYTSGESWLSSTHDPSDVEFVESLLSRSKDVNKKGDTLSNHERQRLWSVINCLIVFYKMSHNQFHFSTLVSKLMFLPAPNPINLGFYFEPVGI